MRYLLVVAHPDDEVLGAGASIWKWAKENNTVDVAFILASIPSFPTSPTNGLPPLIIYCSISHLYNLF